jgi:branched-chain amino acid transport system permease protein
VTRVAVFSVSAGLAGVAGVLLAGMKHTVGTLDFFFFQNLPLLLFAIVFGVTSISGVLVGGFFYGCLSTGFLISSEPLYKNIAYMVVFVGIRLLVNNPNGLIGLLFDQSRRLLVFRDRRGERGPAGPLIEAYPVTVGRQLEAPLGSA